MRVNQNKNRTDIRAIELPTGRISVYMVSDMICTEEIAQ